MSARERILARARAATETAGDPERAARVAARIAAAPSGAVPQQAASRGPERLALFTSKVEAAAASVSRVSGMAELPGALAHELRQRNLPAAVRVGAEPAFHGLDWGAVELSHGVGRIEEPATLSRAEFGLAEIGAVVLASGPDNPVTLTFLGETHFVVVRERDVCGGYDDFWEAWRARGLDPRTINMVVGPSRSADIGQVLQLGAHGPIALHVFLVAE